MTKILPDAMFELNGKNYHCRHCARDITSPLSRASIPLLTAIRDGKLTVQGGRGICDNIAPLLVSDMNGQDISCVGPFDSACPDPTAAVEIFSDYSDAEIGG